jgi:putative membrane protein
MKLKKEIIETIVYVLTYSLVLIIVSQIFKKTIQVEIGLYLIITSSILYLLNKTIKPILVWLTIPITGLTLGLFYPFINVFILKITDTIMGKYFTINGWLMPFIVAIVISCLNIIFTNYVFKRIKIKEK